MMDGLVDLLFSISVQAGQQGKPSGLGDPNVGKPAKARMQGTAFSQMESMAKSASLQSPHKASPESRKLVRDMLQHGASPQELKKELKPQTDRVMQKRSWVPGGTYDTSSTGEALERADNA